MKRYWYLMAIAATLLASCNKDEEEPEVPNRASYGYPKTLMATEKQTTYGTS